MGVDRIGLTGGLTAADLILERRGTNTIVKIASSDEILGIAGRARPFQVQGSFVPVNINLF